LFRYRSFEIVENEHFKKYSKERWKQDWKQKLGINGYFNIQIVKAEICTCPHFSTLLMIWISTYRLPIFWNLSLNKRIELFAQPFVFHMFYDNINNSHAYSGPFRPPIPDESGHRFRTKAATDSG